MDYRMGKNIVIRLLYSSHKDKQCPILIQTESYEAPIVRHLSNKVKLIQFSSVTQSCLTLHDPMGCSTPGLSVHHQLPEFTQTQVH